MSTSKSSEHLGLRFGVEIELVLRSKNQTHSTFESLALEIRQHLDRAKIASHIGDLSQKPTGNVGEAYQDWIIIQDSTLPSRPAESIFGVELVSPIFSLNRQTWATEIQKTWKVLERGFEVRATKECSTHVHLSPGNGRPWSLNESKGIAKAAIFFERCIDALMPGHRRINPYCMSNRWNPRYSQLTIPRVFSDVSQADSDESLGEALCWCSKDSIHAQLTMHEEDFVHPHFRWNFTPLTDRKGTIEFRQPPASKTAGETITWVLFAVSFAQWASERANTLDPTQTAEISDLYKYIRAGAQLSGVTSDAMLGLLQDLFRGVKPLPVPCHDLKGMTEEERNKVKAEAQKKRMPLERYKELFAYE